jgi:serine/threonine protein kinase
MGMLQKKIGAFYLTERIGAGGMSEVLLGLNPRTGEKRAYKILRKRASTAPVVYARFQREVEIIRNLSHPGIIKILDNGIEDEFYYYSMEYMPGGNLLRIMEHGKVPLEETLKLMIPVCEAMAYAHAHAVIHRDLKPANILLSSDGVPILSDFGIAKVMEYERTALTRSGEILGTIAYLAPEQRLSAKHVNQRTDVYALGVLFYEMLMGSPPLGKFPWPREVKADFPNEYQSILEKCLAIKPEDRFADAGALLKALVDGAGLRTAKHAEKGCGEVSAAVAVSVKTEYMETWFRILRIGTVRERLLCVREMTEMLTPEETRSLLKLYPEQEARIRWGLIRVFGELKMQESVPSIIKDLNSPFHAECVLEALGKIAAEESFDPILEFMQSHADSAMLAFYPLVKTGKTKAIQPLTRYLNHEMAVWRQAAVHALTEIPSSEVLLILKTRLEIERDEKVRAAISHAIRSLQMKVNHKL